MNGNPKAHRITVVRIPVFNLKTFGQKFAIGFPVE